jgi:hypothetical protein
MRKDGNKFQIGDNAVLVDQEGVITIKEKEFRGSASLWELLTRKIMNNKNVTSDDIRTYKKILLMNNTHLEGYQPRGVINVTRGKKLPEIDAHFSRSPKGEVSNRGYAAHGKNTEISASELYYDPIKASNSSTFTKLSAALQLQNKSDFIAWLVLQIEYTQHRTARRRFLRNPYTFTNVVDVF